MGQVYTTLDRLQRDGLVRHRLVSQAERPDKKVYELTEPGREELLGWIRTPTVPDLDLRNETYMKLMVSRMVRAGEPRKVIARERRASMDQLSEIEGARKQARTDGEDLGTRLLLDLAALRLDAFLKWLDGCEKALESEEARS